MSYCREHKVDDHYCHCGERKARRVAQTTIQERPVLEQLAEAVKWWNSDEAEEPDVRRLFAACKAEIERLEAALKEADEDMTCRDDDSTHYCPNCDNSLYRARERIRAALRTVEGGGFGK